jgi:hypothetical protein
MARCQPGSNPISNRTRSVTMSRRMGSDSERSRLTGNPFVSGCVHALKTPALPFPSRSQQKTLPLGTGGLWNGSQVNARTLCADDVCRLKAFGALEQVKLHGLTLVERAVAVLLDRGEVHEYIFHRGALDKSIPFRPVEPLHCTFLSHGKDSFHQSLGIVLRLSRSSPRSFEVLSKTPVELAVTFTNVRTRCGRITPKKGKDSSVPHRGMHPPAGTFGARQFGAFPPHPTNVNDYWSHHRTTSRY